MADEGEAVAGSEPITREEMARWLGLDAPDGVVDTATRLETERGNPFSRRGPAPQLIACGGCAATCVVCLLLILSRPWLLLPVAAVWYAWLRRPPRRVQPRRCRASPDGLGLLVGDGWEWYSWADVRAVEERNGWHRIQVRRRRSVLDRRGKPRRIAHAARQARQARRSGRAVGQSSDAALSHARAATGDSTISRAVEPPE